MIADLTVIGSPFIFEATLRSIQSRVAFFPVAAYREKNRHALQGEMM